MIDSRDTVLASEEQNNHTCRIFVVDDDSIISLGLLTALSGCNLITIVGTAGNRGSTIELIRNTRPHVVVFAARPELGSLIGQVLDATDESVAVMAIGEPGSPMTEKPTRLWVTLPWQATIDDVLFGVIGVASENPRLSTAVATELTQRLRHQVHGPRWRGIRLSKREVEVLRRAAEGQTNSCIARALSLSEATVKTYWQRIFKKLKVHDRTTAVTAALSHGILTVPFISVDQRPSCPSSYQSHDEPTYVSAPPRLRRSAMTPDPPGSG